ncbi:hypothetical protein [Geomonas agri]|uniref:hypothetical protein n=1 Tax=Geomonas agri TaxID=2873702 RepID=UPI001CD7CBF5|nr:hypothetical protein [Geomonas agri]
MKKDNLEVLLEDMNRKFDLVLEGHEVLRSEIRELSHKTDERFDLVEFKIETLGKRVDGLEKKVDNLETKVDNLETKVDNLDVKVDKIAVDLSAHRADTEVHTGAYRVMEREE